MRPDHFNDHFKARVRAESRPLAKAAPCPQPAVDALGSVLNSLDHGCEEERREAAPLLEVDSIEVMDAIEAWRHTKN